MTTTFLTGEEDPGAGPAGPGAPPHLCRSRNLRSRARADFRLGLDLCRAREPDQNARRFPRHPDRPQAAAAGARRRGKDPAAAQSMRPSRLHGGGIRRRPQPTNSAAATTAGPIIWTAGSRRRRCCTAIRRISIRRARNSRCVACRGWRAIAASSSAAWRRMAPSLEDFLGYMTTSFDDMVDRAPDGELGGRRRRVQAHLQGQLEALSGEPLRRGASAVHASIVDRRRPAAIR